MIGKTIGHYVITGKLGSGGMGDVYLARDSKLKREVAVKVLPAGFASDPERLARFQREAEVLASLNHAHIAAIYDLADSGESAVLILELVDGDTLADRIARGPLPLDEALRIAAQVAEALEAAHEKGIIHRDLKPANIKIRANGDVKVLDFGLAKVHGASEADRSAGLSNSPTFMSATLPGTIMGTAAYMSPEQAKGRDSARSTDVWAFGCVLYEMLAGRAVFQGETLGELLAEIFKAEPDWNRLPVDTPQGIRRLLRRCLQKSERSRLRDIRDARLEIDDALSGSPEVVAALPQRSRRKEGLGWISAIAVASLIAAAVTAWTLRPTSLPEMRLDIATPYAPNPVALSISPDGQKIVFVARSEGRTQLWFRTLDATSAKPLPGTDGATYPFWSPDSRSAGFFADQKLKRVDLDSGSVRVLAERVLNGRGGAWNRDGIILYNELAGGPLFRVASTAGKGEPVTRLISPQQSGHRFPQFLPDGRHFLYYVFGTPEARGVYVGALDGTETKRLLDADTGAVYLTSGHLLFVRGEKLFAQDFDAAAMTLKGSAFLVADQVAVDSQSIPALSVSDAGLIAYRSGSALTRRRLIWFSRDGKEVTAATDADASNPTYLSISADGQVVALQRTLGGNSDIWLLEGSRNVLRRATFDPSIDYSPMISPDRRRLVYSSNRTGAYDLYAQSLAGAGKEEQLLANSENNAASDWSRDGRLILYGRTSPKTGSDVWALPVDGDRKPILLAQTNFDERFAQFSPDGKWIAYESNESGRYEIYLQPFSNPGDKIQVSTEGGVQVRWGRDPKELFYLPPDGHMMAVPLRFSPDAQRVEIGTAAKLFQTQIDASRQVGGNSYVVSPDGQRFLVYTIVEDPSSPITVILNWKAKP